MHMISTQAMTSHSEEPKTCTNCDQAKPLSDFYERKDRPGKFKPWCKSCMIKAQVERQRFIRGQGLPRKIGRPRKPIYEVIDFNPATDEDVIEAAMVGGFTSTEIAEKLGMTRQGVDNVVIRAIEKLKVNARAMGIEIDFDALERMHKND